MKPEPVLALRGVSKRFGALEVLHDVEFAIGAGELVAVVGFSGRALRRHC